MNGLATHLACLEELERDRRRTISGRVRSTVPALLTLTGSALWIAGCWFFEQLVREKLGLP